MVTDTIAQIPEIQALDQRRSVIRIPDEIDVPVSERVRHLIDTSEFRRLARISQLGLVGMVYPAANHTRFEHSLGVYRMALLYLKQLSHDDRFRSSVSPAQVESLIVAALLHDVGHWPFCHPIEDIRLAGVPDHETFANSFLLEGEIADLLRDQWSIEPREVVALLSEKADSTSSRILQSILSGPIDIDKMDYLYRDSLHAGVPYGKHFDSQRLIGSLCLNQAGDRIAISDKAKTAAEMMVFARYVMFSEVYWHHAVRSATAMLQRAFFLMHEMLDLDALFRKSEIEMIESLCEAAGDGPAAILLDGLFGSNRRLYKRLGQFSFFESPELYERLARRPYSWLVKSAERLSELLSLQLGEPVATNEVIFDAPPQGLEVEFRIDIHFPKENCYRRLEEVSPVVHTLARHQFDDYVKRVRLFIHPRLIDAARQVSNLDALIVKAIDETDGDS